MPAALRLDRHHTQLQQPANWHNSQGLRHHLLRYAVMCIAQFALNDVLGFYVSAVFSEGMHAYHMNVAFHHNCLHLLIVSRYDLAHTDSTVPVYL